MENLTIWRRGVSLRCMAVAGKKEARYDGLRVSREEYLDLADDGFAYDMVEGVLQLSPSAGFDHGHAYGRFFHLLSEYLDARHVGRATLETDVLLPDGGDVLRPDVSFLLNENMHKVRKHLHGAPDLVCEVLSDSTRERDLTEKADRYLRNGVKEYWILDPDAHTIELWINGGQWERHKGNSLESRLLPGFRVSKEEIF